MYTENVKSYEIHVMNKDEDHTLCGKNVDEFNETDLFTYEESAINGETTVETLEPDEKLCKDCIFKVNYPVICKYKK